MDFLGFLPESVMGWVNVIGLTVGCASGVAAAIAKLTKNTKDDALASKLSWLHDKLAFLGLHPKMEVKRAGSAVVSMGGKVVVDHRTPPAKP
jgi:hypothetical protein